MKISEIITDKYKLRIPPAVFYELLADVQEVEEQEPTTKNDLGVDCISRKDAIQAMQDKAKKLTNLDTINGLCGAIAILYDMPSVTPQEPRKGHWIDSEAVLVIGYADTDNFMRLPACECSVCHKPHIRGYRMDYCPNCGADMRADRSEEDGNDA